MKKRMLRLTLTLCLALSLLTGTASAAATPTFADVQEGDWYVEDVAYVYEHGLMDGTAAYTFSPNGKATRAMVITILYRLAGQPASSGDSPFQDVRPLRLVFPCGGVGSHPRHCQTAPARRPSPPNAIITREQLAAFLYRYAGAQGWDTSARVNLNQFQDQRLISSYARTALSWACGEDLLTGSLENGKVYSPPPSLRPATNWPPCSTGSASQAPLRRPPPPATSLWLPPDAEAIFDQMPNGLRLTSGAGDGHPADHPPRRHL